MPELKELDKEDIEKQLDQINKQLKGERPDLKSVQKVLASIPRARLRGDLAAEYHRAKDKYENKAADYAEKQGGKIRQALDRFRNALQKGELPDPDPAIELRVWIKELKDLDLKEDEIPEWSADLRKLEAETEDVKTLFSITEEVHGLWDRAKETEEKNGSATNVIEDYKQAIDIINGALKRRQITWAGPRQRLENILARAERYSQDAHQRHEVFHTKVEGVELVGTYRSFLKDKPEKKITYRESADPEATLVIMTVSQAIPIARDLLVRFWDRKVEEYTRLAYSHLKEHNLEAAIVELGKCKPGVLPGLGDPEIKQDLSYEANLLIEDLEKEIDQTNQKRANAADLCKQSKLSLGTLDYAVALRLLLDAEKADAFAPKVKETRASIHAQMLAEATSHIQNAETRLSEGELENAGKALGEAAALLGISPTTLASSQYLQASDKPSLLALGLKPDVSALSTRIQKVAKTLEDIEKTEASVAQKIRSDPAQAKKILDSFVRKYGEDQVEQWEAIHSLVNQVEINYNAKKVLAKIQALVGTNSTIAELEKSRKEYTSSVQGGIPQDYQSDFESLRQEIEARLGYLRALETKGTPVRALELLKPALEYPPLKKQAGELKKELELKKASDAKIAEMIEAMPDRIATNPREEYEKARKYEGQNDDLDELIQQAKDAWEKRTIEDIERLSGQTLTLSSIKQIRSLLKQLKEMESAKAHEYKEKCELPCAAAEAGLLEEDAPTGKATWAVVATAWKKAGELADEYNEAGQASEYSTKERQARKRQTQETIRSATPEKQIEVYAKLNDEFRGQDAEVLRWLGEAYLNIGVKLIKGGSGSLSRNTQTPREYLEEAERALESAKVLETNQSSSSQIEKLLSRARSLGEFEEQKQRIAALLQHTQISVTDCTKAKDLYLNTKTEATKTEPEFAKHLVGWWEERVRDAREIVQNQAQKLPQDADLFTKISPWICILILSDNPEGEIEAVRRVRMLNDVVRDLERKIEGEVDDFSASAHSDVYGRFDSTDLSDEKKSEVVGAQMQAVLDKQISVCGNLRDSLREPQSAVLIYSNLRLPEGDDLQNRLIEATQRLDEWTKRLRAFKKTVADVKAWADASLRTGDFTSAKKALGSGTGNPDPAFLGFYSHPTYIWLDNYVDGLDAKWSNQQEHKQTIEWCFRFEHSTTLDEFASIEQEWERENVIAGGDVKDKHRELIRKLRTALDKQRQYPLEFALAEMKAMQRDDPADACTLQGKIKYDPDKPTSALDGLKRILPVFQARVDRLIAVETWLTKITGASPREDWEGQKGKLTEWWSRQKKEIEEKRDTGFLKTAKEMCERLLAEVPAEDGSKIDGFVPLGCAHKWLEELPDPLTDPQPKDSMMRDLREKRDDWAKMLDAQVADCKAILKNIEWRREKRDERKDLVLITRNNLHLEQERTGRFHFRNRLADRMKEFRQAIEAYKEICPREEWFLEILKEEGLE